MQRVLILIMALGLIGLAVIVVGGALAALVALLRVLLRALAIVALAGAIAVLGGVLVSTLTSQYTDLNSECTGILAGGLLVLTILLAGRWRRKRAVSAGLRNRTPASSDEPVPESPTDDDLTTAWREAGRLAPSAKLHLAAVEARTTRMLRLSDADPFDMEALDYAVIIRRRVPELVRAAVVLCEDASRDDRRRTAQELVASLEEIGGDADQQHHRFLHSARARFDLLRSHISNRMRRTGPV